MIKYFQQEMIYDCMKGDNAIMFLDVNAQGILELDPVGRRLLSEFPDVALQYRAACAQGLFLPGSIRYYESNGYEIILGCTTVYRIGKALKDDDESIQKATEQIIDKLGKEYTMRKFVSGIINRHSTKWADTSVLIASSGLDWSIYRE